MLANIGSVGGYRRIRAERFLGDANTRTTLVPMQKRKKKHEIITILINTKRLTDCGRVGDLVWTAFRATLFHFFDQFAGLLPSSLGTTAVDGRRITIVVRFDPVVVHLLEEFQCFWPEFFVVTVGYIATGFRGRRRVRKLCGMLVLGRLCQGGNSCFCKQRLGKREERNPKSKKW
jgi:hypothetical protein